MKLGLLHPYQTKHHRMDDEYDIGMDQCHLTSGIVTITILHTSGTGMSVDYTECTGRSHEELGKQHQVSNGQEALCAHSD
jgi:hypothetical protein